MFMEDLKIYKYPRTHHIEGSRLQLGDEDLTQVPFEIILGRHLIIEEKLDGANSAISFSPNGELLIQSRGHYLTGGYRERHYNLMKKWAVSHKDLFFDILGTKYIMYGEWLYAKHTIFYDALPNYFLEFDIMDRETGIFLDTQTRHKLLKKSPVVSVPVLGEGIYSSREKILSLIGQSKYITKNQRENLYNAAVKLGLDPEKNSAITDLSGLMEGLYIKLEENGQVLERMKFVRAEFLQCVDFSDSHWIDRPIIPNQLIIPIGKLF